VYSHQTPQLPSASPTAGKSGNCVYTVNRTVPIKISDTGHQTFGPVGSQDHDDLLLSLSLALWVAERRPAVIPMTSHVPRGTFPTQHDRFGPYGI
jgi:hypothetical protein